MEKVGLLLLLLCASTATFGQNVDEVYKAFALVPDTTRTKVWWFHGENITTRDGITADLEAYKAAGVGGVVYYDQQHGPGAEGSLPAMSPEWWESLKFAAKEAQRIGLSFEINISNGYVAGGPWITPELGMQALYSKATVIKGGVHYQSVLPSPGRKYECDVAVLAFPSKAVMHETVTCLPERVVTATDTTVMIAAFAKPFTARSLAYKSDGESKGAQSIMNVPCNPQDEFCGNRFTLLPSLGELEVSMDSLQWQTVCSLPPCYRMASLRPNYTVSFAATTGRWFRLHLHDWSPTGKSLSLENVELSVRAATYRWEERAAFVSEYIRPAKTPDYHGDEVIDPTRMLDISDRMDAEGQLDWTAPEGTDWLVLRFVYAPTMAKTKHGRPNLIGLECDKLSVTAAETHWQHYPQAIIDSLAAIGCKPAGVCMDSHEAGCQNWTGDFPELFSQECGYDITPWLPAMQGYIVGSVEETEIFLSDLRRTIADGISNRYFATMQRLADSAGVHLTAQASGNGQSICSDNLMAKGRVERPQGEFWARHRDGAYDIKEASSAAHLYGHGIASAEAFTDFDYTHSLGDMKEGADMAAAFQVNELVVCASESQPWLDRYPGNTGYNRDYAMNRNNTLWPLSRPFWDYQARNSFIQRQGMPVVDLLVYVGDDAPMKILAHRLPMIPEGYDFDVCTTDGLLQLELVQDTMGRKVLQTAGGMTYRMLAIEKSAVLRPETERKIAEWHVHGMPVYDNRFMDDDALAHLLDSAGIAPDMCVHSNYCPTDRVWFTHRRTVDADYYFIVNHSKTTTFADTIILRTDHAAAEWWNTLDGSRQMLPSERTGGGLRIPLRLVPDEAGFIVAREKAADGLGTRLFAPTEWATSVTGPWTVTFDTLLGGSRKPVVFECLTDWTASEDPDVRFFSGKATYERVVQITPVHDGRLRLRLPEMKGVAQIFVNGKDAGIVWCTPWEADITGLVCEGDNLIRIDVRNSIVNRIVGDAVLPEAQRHTWSYTKLYQADSPLVPSGMVGEVLLVYE